MRTLPALVLACLVSGIADAAAATSQDFDLACAIVGGAKMGTGSTIMLPIVTFYLGRLSARDETKTWNKIVLGRVAELEGGCD